MCDIFNYRLKQLTGFKYLGNMITENGRIDMDIYYKITKASKYSMS